MQGFSLSEETWLFNFKALLNEYRESIIIFRNDIINQNHNEIVFESFQIF